MSKRTISINPQFFNVSKKKNKKIIPSQVNINASNIRQLLLDKLKEHKKTRKIITDPKIETPLQEKSFDDNCKELDKEKNHDKVEKVENIQKIEKVENIEKEHTEKEHIETSTSKPYGNLKNGIKPTYRMYHDTPQPNDRPQNDMPIDKPIILEEKEVKKTFKLGKNTKTKTISILIKNNKSRKKVEDKKTEHKKTHLSTIKNYLKKKNLIKYGSTAPTKLLREMYETSELCGGISNENKDVLIHNFDK